MMKRCVRTLAITLTAAVLGACGSSVKLDDPPVESRTPAPVSPADAAPPAPAAPPAAATVPQSQVASVTAGQMNTRAADGLPPGVGRVVYFDFDSFALRADAKPVVEAHSRILALSAGRKMVVEGHTDDRGGREYNLALGQRRAEAVVKAMVLLGAREAQLEAVSFGKERPASEGGDEAAWAKNRRAEIKDRP